MTQDSQGTNSPTDSVLQIGRTPEARLVVFTCRWLLVLNLLSAVYFCLVVVPGIKWHRVLFMDMGVQLPGFTQTMLSIPPTVLWANAAGLALILIVLEFVVHNVKVYLICNTVALVLFLGAIVLVDYLLRLPLFNIMWNIHKQ